MFKEYNKKANAKYGILLIKVEGIDPLKIYLVIEKGSSAIILAVLIAEASLL